jgi:hypothetical protein
VQRPLETAAIARAGIGRNSLPKVRPWLLPFASDEFDHIQALIDGTIRPQDIDLASTTELSNLFATSPSTSASSI